MYNLVMTTMNVSLPDEMKSFVDAQIANGGYSTASEYIRMLVRDAQKRAAEEKLEKLLLEGLESGPGKPFTAEDWEGIRRRARARIEAKKRR